MRKKTVHDLLDATISEDIIVTETERNHLRMLLLKLLESEGLVRSAPTSHVDTYESPLLIGSMYIDHDELSWPMIVNTASIIVSFLGGGMTGHIGAGLSSLDLVRSIWKNCMKLSAQQLAIVAHLRRFHKPTSIDDLADALNVKSPEIIDDVTYLTAVSILRCDHESHYTVDETKLGIV